MPALSYVVCQHSLCPIWVLGGAEWTTLSSQGPGTDPQALNGLSGGNGRRGWAVSRAALVPPPCSSVLGNGPSQSCGSAGTLAGMQAELPNLEKLLWVNQPTTRVPQLNISRLFQCTWECGTGPDTGSGGGHQCTFKRAHTHMAPETQAGLCVDLTLTLTTTPLPGPWILWSE